MENFFTRGGKILHLLYIIYLARSTLSKFYQIFLSILVINPSIFVTNHRQQKNFKLILFYKQTPFNYTIPRINFQDSTQVYPVFNSVATYPSIKFTLTSTYPVLIFSNPPHFFFIYFYSTPY